VVAVPDVLDFQAATDSGSASVERADPDAALIEPVRDRPNVWKVTLPDSSDTYRCRYERDHGALVGNCECPGYEHHGGPANPCVHLCTLRAAEIGHVTDTYGARVRAVDADEVRAQGQVERVMADGGLRGGDR
jgi:hypothetical protein